MDYNRIRYPERAEYLNEGIFSDYKIFLGHWKPIAMKLKSNHEEALLRRVSKTLLIFGDQSTGKTLLAKKIAKDFVRSKEEFSSSGNIQYDKDNIWHLITSGYGLNSENIKTNTDRSTIYHIEDNNNWVRLTSDFCKSNEDRTCVIIADNCEKDYFIQSLVGMSDIDYLAVGRTNALIKRAANNFVSLCRGDLRGAFVIMFTNDQDFALNFEFAVNEQHSGLVEIETLPFPGNVEKETVIRVNTNRLNPFSYWFCLDRAGIDEKKNAYNTIKTAKNYKDCFHAIDTALQKADASRIGRPPKKCLLTLFVMTDLETVTNCSMVLDIDGSIKNLTNDHVDITTYSNGWCKLVEGDVRKQRLLESEWNLRFCVVSNKFIRQILGGENTISKGLIDKCLVHHGPGTWETTKAVYQSDFITLIESIPNINSVDIDKFWSMGQIRSHEYERKLKEIYPNYNITTSGFLTYRPDLMVSDYVPCSLLLSAEDADARINDAIRRNTIVCEFTSIKEFNITNISTYLSTKLTNYISILENQ